MSKTIRSEAYSKVRNYTAIAMRMQCKGGIMKDRRNVRGGAKNKQKEYQKEYLEG
jgi:adenylate kinase